MPGAGPWMSGPGPAPTELPNQCRACNKEAGDTEHLLSWVRVPTDPTLCNDGWAGGGKLAPLNDWEGGGAGRLPNQGPPYRLFRADSCI